MADHRIAGQVTAFPHHFLNGVRMRRSELRPVKRSLQTLHRCTPLVFRRSRRTTVLRFRVPKARLLDGIVYGLVRPSVLNAVLPLADQGADLEVNSFGRRTTSFLLPGQHERDRTKSSRRRSHTTIVA